MQLLSLKEQQDIVKVIEWLTERHLKENTVAEVMKQFGLTMEEYRMCCNLAMPALALGNMKLRLTAMSKQNKAMRKEIRALYDAVKDDEGVAADGVRLLFKRHCTQAQNVVYGEDDEE